MNRLRSHSIVYRIAVGPQAGKKAFTLQTLPAREAEAGRIGQYVVTIDDLMPLFPVGVPHQPRDIVHVTKTRIAVMPADTTGETAHPVP